MWWLLCQITPCILIRVLPLQVVDDTFFPNLNSLVLNHVKNCTHRPFAVLLTERSVFDRPTLPWPPMDAAAFARFDAGGTSLYSVD